MKVVAAGTGPAEGFPVSGCECAACRAARRDGVRQGPARLRIEAADGAMLVLTASGVRGPVPAGFEVSELPADGADAVLVTVASEPGTGVLWAVGSGEMVESILTGNHLNASREAAGSARPADGSAGPRSGSAEIGRGTVGLAVLGPGPDGDLTGCARTLAALRRSGMLTPDARTVLIGATHNSVRGARRRLLLDTWNLAEATQGQEWALPAAPGSSSGPSRRLGRVLLIGGSASGKSQLAEDLLAASPEVSYLATGRPADPDADPEWARRVQWHQQRRPDHWQTVETTDPTSALEDVTHPLLLDSLGSWLTGVLDRAGAWAREPGWQDRLAGETRALTTAWSSRPGPVVAVTEEVGWGVVPATESGRLFRDLLGQLNQAVAGASDEVIVVVAGQLMSPWADPAGDRSRGPAGDRP